ncbi:helix-turn-helix domain-containing protein [Nocardioides bizhenqiangii]|uniref:Helix-turn-helix transcriptional regulator n=1 Tax=Nocardioides bizhenqiangii TaxID=3095076 RepID=A0ABZ0ZVV9_9ACTN|nr:MULTISPECIES: helix-turn-helix transcriptional regulator [unclassified Nocardioides]MDZ5622340.1 helix-turn-helix transcriptional regulator [Nocardioides sp. HM23]WQQ28492.1 helix-turn-helix transcriptional regulator [Nocardioides sp. HM61]
MTDQTHAETETAEAAGQVEVRRNVVLSGIVGAVAAVLTIAFAFRAFGDGSALDWALFAVLGVITVLHVAAVADARAPLLVADRLGVRLRQGADWQGIAWDDIECMEHLPRRLPLHDGHLLVVGESGQQLIVPLTLATRVVGVDASTISDELAVLADGRADVVEVVPGIEEDVADDVDLDDATGADDAVSTAEPAVEQSEIGPLAEDTARLERRGIAAEVEKRFRDPLAPPSGAADVDEADTGDSDDDTVDSIDPVVADASTDEMDAVRDDDPTPPPPGRPVASAARVEVQHTGSVQGSRADHTGRSHPTIGANALLADPAVGAGAEPDSAQHNLTVVLDDLAVHPAPDPIIGPQLEAARERLRLTVDQLSERTRIRPHVIEAIEVDDFGPCGGDFYARGHLRTLARVLGIDAGPLVASYDETYADAPVDPRRVFESELATGVGGSIRGTRGGRNWSVLLAAVMAAVLIWSIARLVMDGPVALDDAAPLRQTGSGGIGGGAKAEAVPVTLTATAGGARVIVRDGSGETVFKGPLAFGQTSELEVVPPVRIWTSDGSVTAGVDCKDPQPLGETGSEASKSLPAC